MNLVPATARNQDTHVRKLDIACRIVSAEMAVPKSDFPVPRHGCFSLHSGVSLQALLRGLAETGTTRLR